MKLPKNILIASLVAVFSLGSVPALAGNDYIERKIYQDKNYAAVKQNAINLLKKRGYHVTDIEADTHFQKPALSVEAYKNGQEYDLKLSYPDLKILKEKLDK